MTDPRLDYISKVYSALQDNVSGFDKTPGDFLDSMNNPDYRSRVYSALKDNVQGFNKSPQDFESVTAQKKNSIGTSTPSKYVAAPPLEEYSPSQSVSNPQSSSQGSNQQPVRQPQKPPPFDPATFMRQSRANILQNSQPAKDNTIAVQPKEAIEAQYNKEHIPEWNQQKADYKAKVIKATPDAITNAAVKSLKIKGIDPNNAALLNKEKQNFQQQVEDGDATVSFDKDGTPGLVQNPGFFKSFHDHMMAAINENKEAREFHNMTDDQKVKFANQQLTEKPSAYIGEKPTNLGSVGAMAGGALPTLGLYAAGAAAGGVLESLAPETGGLSNLALKPVMSFVTNAGSEANKSEMNGVIQRYAQIKSHYPDLSDEQAMAEAKKGADVDRLAGIGQAALFSETGGILGKSVTRNFIKEAVKSGVDIGAKSAIVEGAKDVGHNAEGVTNKSLSDIAKDMGSAFAENAPMGTLLHAFMGVATGVAKAPALIKSALKYDISTKIPPEQVTAELEKNVQSGAISADDANKAEADLNQFRQTLQTVPSYLSDEAKASVTGLMIKRDNLLAQSKGLDKTAQDLSKQQTDAIDNQIKEVYRTGKPLEAEINPATGQTYEKLTYDDVAQQQVQDLAGKIAKGKQITDPQDLQTQANFPKELEAELTSISKKEIRANANKVNPNNDIIDNINKYKTESRSGAEKVGESPAVPEKAAEKPAEPVSSPVISDKENEALYGKDGETKKKLDFTKGKPIVEPPKPISEMNSDELYNYSQDVKKALSKQDKEFVNKTESEKEAAGYYDYIDNVSDLRDTAQRVNFVENSENLDELANSTKSALRDFNKDNPSDESLAILNAAKKKAAEMNIAPETLIKEVIKKVGNDYKDKDDAELMMRSYLEKVIPKGEQPSKPTNIEENTSTNKQEAVPSTTDLEGFGGKGGRNRLYDRVKNLDEPTDIDGKILHYFAGGGKVHPESFSKEVVGMKRKGYGDKEGSYPSEVKGNTLVKTTDENGKPNPTIKQLSESFGDGTNDQEIRNTIIDVLQSHGSRESAATELINKYDQEYIESKRQKEENEYWEGLHKKEVEAEENYLTEKGKDQDEIEQDPDYIKHLIKLYEAETISGNGERATSGSETESDQARSTSKVVEPERVDRSERPSDIRGSAEDKSDPNEGKPENAKEQVKAGDIFRNFADIIDKGKISKLGGFKTSTGFDAVWDGSLSVVSAALRKTGDLADAIQQGLEHIKKSDWYKNLTDKKDFDEKYVAHLEDEYTKFNEQPEKQDQEKSGTLGISHEALNALAEKIGLPEIERGKSYDPKELADRGRKLLNAGADPNKIADTFYTNGRTDENGVSVIRAKIEQLFKIGEQIDDKGSTSFKENFDQLSKFMQVEKDMGTFAHRVMKSFQGQRDIDTDSFVFVSMAAEHKLGRELNREEKSKIDGLTKQVLNLKSKISEYEERLKNAIDKDLTGESKPEVKLSVSEKAKKLAEVIRKGKAHKPGVFSAATPASLVWDTAVETVAQVVEKGGKLVDAIQKGVEYIKETDWYKGLSEDKKKEAEDAFIKEHRDSDGTSLESLQEMLADKKGDKFTPQEAKAIWDYAKKQYLNTGSDYLEMLSGVANDLGYTMTQVSKAIITPKTQRLSDEMWKQRSELSKNRASVKRWLDNKGGNLAYKGFKTAIDTFREAAVFGHGAIFIGTHAMPTLFDIPRAKYTIKGFLNAYKAAYGKTSNYELMIADLKNSENYLKAQRAGLQNNPERIGSDTEIISHHLKWFSEAGERGFNAIKILRQNLFDSHYNALPETLKQDPEVLKEIAQIVNNATGATNAKVPNWMREVTFAGGMEISRWERIIKNPAKAADILGKLAKGNATPADRVFLRVWATRAGTIAGVYTSALIMNNALNAYLYPDDDKKRINFFNPSKGDWFKLKFGSVVIDPTSGMGTSLRFLTTIASMPFQSEKYIKSHNQGDNRKNALAKKVLGYGLGKLSPGYTTIGELVLKHDYTGNTIPFSNDKPFYKSARKLTLTEYGEHKLPLPLAEGFEIYNDAAHEAGADDKTWNAYMKGVLFGGLSGLTGVRSYENTKDAESDKKETFVPYYHSPD